MSSINSMTAHNYWATKPVEERFWAILGNQGAWAAATKERAYCSEGVVELPNPTIRLDRNELLLLPEPTKPAIGKLSNWAYKQLCGDIGVPAPFVATLQPRLAMEIINSKIANRGWTTRNLLIDKLDQPKVLSMNSESYGRIWDDQSLAFGALLQTDYGFRIPPARPAFADSRARPATQEDLVAAGNLSLSIKVGDSIAPGAVFKGGSYSFALLVDDEKIIDGGNSPLFRGVIIKNSQVGDKYQWEMIFFMFSGVCGNLIIHDMQTVGQIKVRHRGAASLRAEQRFLLSIEASKAQSVDDEQMLVNNARNFILGNNEDEIVEALTTRKITGKKVGAEAFGLAEQRVDWYGKPNTAWAISNALSEISQHSKFSDDRYDLDEAAGRLLHVK